jgi:cell division protein FtsN
VYAFLFDRRALTFLLIGLGGLGAVLFTAGLLVGLHRNLPEVRSASSLGPPLPVRPARAPQAPVTTVPDEPPATEPGAPTGSQPATASDPSGRETEPPPPRVSPAPRPLVVVEQRWRPEPSRAVPSRPAPTRPAPPQSVALAALGGGAFTLQVGAYGIADNAHRRVDGLSRQGFAADIVDSARGARSPLHVVLVGRFATAAEAARAAAEFTAAGHGDALVRPLGP